MAEQIETDKASWAEVQVTCILTLGTSAIFLAIFEIARRSPVISAVFDRRRNTKPHRTPPPLLSSSMFEWLFLSSEPRYSEFSDLSHMRDVIQERRRQRNPGRSGFFSSNRGSRDNGDSGRSPTSDLDSPRDSNDPRVSAAIEMMCAVISLIKQKSKGCIDLPVANQLYYSICIYRIRFLTQCRLSERLL